jgi:O-antigen/teichoic acid export membrane protein
MTKEKLYALVRDRKKQDFFIYGLGQGFNLIGPLVVVPYLIRICGEAGYGKIGLGFALALFLILIVDYAFEIRGTKEVSANREDREAIMSLLNITLFAKMFLFTVTLLILLALIGLIPFVRQEKTLFLYSMAVVLAQVFNPAWFLQGVENFRTVSLLNICSKTTYVVLVYLMISQEDDYIFVNLLLGGSSLLFNLAGLAYVTSLYRIKFRIPQLDVIRDILKADFSVCMSQLFLSARQHSPLFLAAYLLGYHAAGQFRIIEHILSLYRTSIQMLMRFFYPSLCFKISKDISSGIAYWKQYTKYSLIFIAASLAVLFMFSEEVLVFFNASADTIKKLGFIFKIELIIPLLMALSLPLEQLMFATNRNKAYVRISISVTVVCLLFLFVAIKTYGILGIIVSLILAEVLFITLYSKHSLFSLKDKG